MTAQNIVNDVEFIDTVTDAGDVLNHRLIVEKDLSKDEVLKLVYLHNKKDEIMRKAHDKIKEIEFQMQDVWGFERDESKHTHRFNIPYPEKLI